MNQNCDLNWNGDGQLEVLTFDLGGETFAIEAGMVAEILDNQLETRVPGATALADALINFRGNVIPLADLRLAFGLERAEHTTDSRTIIIELQDDGDTLIGLKADKVYEVTTVGKTHTEPPPKVGMRWRPELIRQFVKRGGDFIVVPNLERLFVQGTSAEIPGPAASFTQL